ncbi:co-chaperone YbbN [Novosphingobium sp. TH158]|uniref:thioredoxin family protein n=1 Tax=Novosphingobium sp. TH158 TaxID=2067455 RepID=UPI001304594C|nr:thioredoxin family protein [Novosphingobium sp. TH158]
MILRPALLALAAIPLAAPASAASEPATVVAARGDFFPATEDGAFALETAIAEARASDRLAVIVFGADWCHDSRTLARVLTSPEFTERFGQRFTVTFINVGEPQTGKGRNLDLVAGLGLRNLRSTPALFVLSGKGKVLNTTADARSWRNADSRGQEKILGWFERFLSSRPPLMRRRGG